MHYRDIWLFTVFIAGLFVGCALGLFIAQTACTLTQQ